MIVRHERVFDQAARRFGQTLLAVDNKAAIKDFERQFNPYRIAGNDVIRWVVLLICDQPNTKHGVTDLSHRTISALSNSALGPRVTSNDQRIVIRRLISHWIETHPSIGTRREQLLVAMRFNCLDRADRICDRVFADRNASPSTQVTALLVANVLGREDLLRYLHERLDDDRTAHVWQLIASRKTKIRTPGARRRVGTYASPKGNSTHVRSDSTNCKQIRGWSSAITASVSRTSLLASPHGLERRNC